MIEDVFWNQRKHFFPVSVDTAGEVESMYVCQLTTHETQAVALKESEKNWHFSCCHLHVGRRFAGHGDAHQLYTRFTV
jgi:hypothetical protein